MTRLLLMAGLVMGAAPLSVRADRPRDLCRAGCREAYYELYLACVSSARKTSEIARCAVIYNYLARECERAICR